MRLLFVAALTFLLAPVAQAQDDATWAGQQPRELLERSISTPSNAERWILRGYLAREHAETPEGVYARASILAADGDREAAIALYQGLAETDPVMPAQNLSFQLGSAGRYDEAVAVLRRALAGTDDPERLVPLLRNLYFYQEDATDQAAAERVLEEYAAHPAMPEWVVAYLHGIRAQSSDRDFPRAAELFEQVVAAGGAWEAHSRLADIRLDHLSGSELSRTERLRLIQPVVDYMRAHADEPAKAARAALYLARRFNTTFAAKADAFRMYAGAFELYPTAEAAVAGYRVMREERLDEAIDLLTTAERRLPENYHLLGELSRHHLEYATVDEEKIREYGEAAIRLAPTATARAARVEDLAEDLAKLGRYDESHRLLSRHLEGMTGAPARTLLTRLVLDRLYAGSYGAARDALERRRAAGDLREAWYRGVLNEIEHSAAAEEARLAFYREHPFLQAWEERFGQALTLRVGFAHNSAVVPPAADAALTRIAEALTAPGADDYVFLIDGHASRSEDAPDALAKRRAEAVAARLHERYGIARTRLQPVGYGAAYPAVSSVAGSNARVEVQPAGRLSEPQVAASSLLDARSLVATPDLRLAAVGLEPMQLWDLRRGVRLRDLGRGGAPRAFSPNGRYLAASSEYTVTEGFVWRVIYVYDTKTGLVHDQIRENVMVRSLSWSPDSDALVYSVGGYVKVYDLEARAVRAVVRPDPRAGRGEVLWLADGRHIVTGEARGSRLSVYDAETMERVRTLPGVDWVHSLGQSHDGRYLVAFDNTRTMSVWDTGRWEGPRQTRASSIPKQVLSHPTEPWVIVNSAFDDRSSINVVDLETLETRASHVGEPTRYSLGIAPDGSAVVAGAGDAIRRFATSTLDSIATVVASPSERPYSLEADSRRGLLLSGDSEGVHVWDLETGRKAHLFEVPLGSDRFQPLDREAGEFLAVGDDDRAWVISIDDFTQRPLLQLDFDVSRVVTAGDLITFLGKPHDPPRGGDDTGIAVTYDHRTGEIVSRFEVELPTEYLRYGGSYEGGFSAAALRHDGLLALSTYWMDGYARGNTYSERARLYDTRTGEPVSEVNVERRVRRLGFAGDTLLAGTNFGFQRYHARTAAPLDYEQGPLDRALRLDDGRTLTWNELAIRLEEATIHPAQAIVGLAVDESRNLIATLSGVNELTLYDLRDLERQLTIIPQREGEWLAYAPDGTFSASLHGADHAIWTLGDHTLPFEALRERMERPRLIQSRLAALAAGEITAPQSVEISPDLFNAPYTLTVPEEELIETTQRSYTVTATIEKADPALPTPGLTYRLNGRDLERAAGLPEPVVEEDGAVVTVRQEFPLHEGYNAVELALDYKGARLQRQRVEIERAASRGFGDVEEARIAAEKPDLYFFGVGVSEYAIAAQNLSYPDDDVRAVERLLRAQQDGIFANVHTRTLVDEEATGAAIQASLREFLGQASAEDVIVVFIAGHGVQDGDQNLWFMAHEANVAQPATGLHIDTFRGFLDSRPAGQKALFMLDICHAGVATRMHLAGQRRGRITAEDAIQQLTQGTGSVVFASSTGRQASLEAASFGEGHGAFTAALLEALDGMADGNADGYNSVQEMILYTSQRVPEITDNRQHPTSGTAGLRDYPISAAGEGD